MVVAQLGTPAICSTWCGCGPVDGGMEACAGEFSAGWSARKTKSEILYAICCTVYFLGSSRVIGVLDEGDRVREF